MALVALVLVRLAGELIIVFVHVAIRAALKIRNLEDRVLAFGRVALVAGNLGMAINQRVVGLGVRFHIEQRWLPAFHVVTAFALDPVRLVTHELPVVLVLVAVGALGEGQLLLEVAFGVAGLALHRGVLSFQRVLGFRVIEIIGQSAVGNLLP